MKRRAPPYISMHRRMRTHSKPTISAVDESCFSFSKTHVGHLVLGTSRTPLLSPNEDCGVSIIVGVQCFITGISMNERDIGSIRAT